MLLAFLSIAAGLVLLHELAIFWRGPFDRFERKRVSDLARARYLTRLPDPERYDIPPPQVRRVPRLPS
jgi:hypothetical protein